jgi:hypothetical protein
MARFIECRTSQGVVYQVNVDQITCLQRGARDEYTRIHFVRTDQSIGVQSSASFGSNRPISTSSLAMSENVLPSFKARSGSSRHSNIAIRCKI